MSYSLISSDPEFSKSLIINYPTAFTPGDPDELKYLFNSVGCMILRIAALQYIHGRYPSNKQSDIRLAAGTINGYEFCKICCTHLGLEGYDEPGHCGIFTILVGVMSHQDGVDFAYNFIHILFQKWSYFNNSVSLSLTEILSRDNLPKTEFIALINEKFKCGPLDPRFLNTKGSSDHPCFCVEVFAPGFGTGSRSVPWGIGEGDSLIEAESAAIMLAMCHVNDVVHVKNTDPVADWKFWTGSVLTKLHECITNPFGDDGLSFLSRNCTVNSFDLLNEIVRLISPLSPGSNSAYTLVNVTYAYKLCDRDHTWTCYCKFKINADYEAEIFERIKSFPVTELLESEYKFWKGFSITTYGIGVCQKEPSARALAALDMLSKIKFALIGRTRSSDSQKDDTSGKRSRDDGPPIGGLFIIDHEGDSLDDLSL